MAQNCYIELPQKHEKIIPTNRIDLPTALLPTPFSADGTVA